MLQLTFISDTHNKHKQLNQDLIGGDVIIHCGDFTSVGYLHEIKNFLDWYSKLPYTTKIFISGNHDCSFEDSPMSVNEILKNYPDIVYLENDLHLIGDDYESAIKIWGSPYQPEFNNWSFNLPRGGEELKHNWDLIPFNTDILITHGPPQTILDTSGPPWNNSLLGCDLLLKRIEIVKPKIHIFGHIHKNGYRFVEYVKGIDYKNKLHRTHFINCSVLNEQYNYTQTPINCIWDPITNKIEFL